MHWHDGQHAAAGGGLGEPRSENGWVPVAGCVDGVGESALVSKRPPDPAAIQQNAGSLGLGTARATSLGPDDGRRKEPDKTLDTPTFEQLDLSRPPLWHRSCTS